MARAAVLGRLTWRTATAVVVEPASAEATTVTLDVPGWPGHLAGQHVDVRLTAPDGYTATRAYSIASAPDGERIQVTVGAVVGGEVSTYLARDMVAGDQVEVRGPLGGWFVWHPQDPQSVQLVAGGVGLVPLMAMIRTRAAEGVATPMRLVYSVRSPTSALYTAELGRESARVGGVPVTWRYTRVPDSRGGPVGRIDTDLLEGVALPPGADVRVYVCGPTPFVESVTALLVALGHVPETIRAERFGPTGGKT